jgi:von Willebrand factor type A domain
MRTNEMKTRHKIPAVFSIYMVDVLCCALGCVILLWQLYHHESEEQTAANEEIRAENDDISKKNAAMRAENEDLLRKLANANFDKDELAKKYAGLKAAKDAILKKLAGANLALKDQKLLVDSLQGDLDANLKKQKQLAQQLAELGKDRDQAAKLVLVKNKEYEDMKKTLAAAEAMLAVLRLDLKTQEQKSTLKASELAEKIRAHADLLDKLAEAEKKIRALTKDLLLKETDAQAVAKKVDEKSNLLKLLEQELALLRSQNKDVQTKLTSADKRAVLLARDLSVLEQDKVALLKKAAAAENRFAGITLTGRRVIFLVDMSGSMDRVDEATFDPDKWPIVCETVASIMRSLPDLRAYQVILFSDRFKYAFGKDGRWLEYNPETSPKNVADGLKAIKPKGGTDMHAAFREAFNFRDTGLDTIYLFSDGLPNMGDGLPANAAKLTESQRCEILGKHIRGLLKNTWNRSVTGQARVKINCVGFFFESPDLGAFLWALAREHEGSFVGMSRP